MSTAEGVTAERSSVERGALPLGLAHELGVLLASTSAILLVLLGGAFAPWAWMVTLAPPLSFLLARRELAAPAISGTLIALGALLVGVTQVLQRGLESVVFAGGAALLGLLVARLITRRTLVHDQQVLLLSLVLVLAGSVLNVGVTFFVTFVIYAVALVWALSTRQLLRGAEETGGLSRRQARARDDVVTPLFFAASAGLAVAVLLAAGAVFVAFPRIGFGELSMLMGQGNRLPSQVGLSGDPRGLSTSTEVVARVRGLPEPAFLSGLYLRGIVYDELTLSSFSQSEPALERATIIDARPVLRLASTGTKQRYEVTLLPGAGDLLFTLGDVIVARTLSGGSSNPNRSVSIRGRDRHDQLRTAAALAAPLRYEVHGSFAQAGVYETGLKPTSIDVERYLRLPDNLDPRVQAMLRQALGEAHSAPTPDKVSRIRRYFSDHFRYSLEPVVQGKPQPLLAFLVEDRAGHCELFASGFALLLRQAGIPARVVGGYQGGAWDDSGGEAVVVFQQRHAHAWVEWWLPEVGWITDDATPEPSQERDQLRGVFALLERARRFWDDRIVDYDLQDQTSALKKVSDALRGKHLGTLAKAGVAGFGIVVVIVAAWRLLRNRTKQRPRLDVLTTALLDAVSRVSGVEAAPTATVRELVLPLLEEAAAPLVWRDALRIYEAARFGNRPPSAQMVEEVVAGLRALPSRPGGRDARA